MGTLSTLQLLIDRVSLRVLDVQISNRSCDRLDYTRDEAADRKPTGSWSGHGTLPSFSRWQHADSIKTEKVFDIACAVADVLPFISVRTPQMELGPIDYLTQVVSLLSRLPGGANKFVPLLFAKINELRPELIGPLCAAAQLPFNDAMSPDTRFLYEEEVGTGLYADLRRAR